MEAAGERVFAKLGVENTKDPLAAARAMPWEKIVEAGNEVAAEIIPPNGPWNVVDGWFLPDTPVNIFKKGKQNVIPFIIGSTLGELTGPGPLVKSEWILDYVNLLKGASNADGKSFAYIFDKVPEGWKKDGAVSAHNMDVLYVFGDWDNTSGF
jgi:carboxylesterase type B